MVIKSEIERLFTWIVPHMAVLLNSLALFEIVSEYFLKFQNVKNNQKKNSNPENMNVVKTQW